MKYYIVSLTLLSCVSICGTTLLWRINVNPPAYLLGTVHLPSPYIWPYISSTAKSAFDNSTHFLPEFDITNFFSFTRFRTCINSHALPIANGPPVTSAFASQHESQPPILDVYLMLEARRMRKNVESLENVDIYCEFTKFQAESLAKTVASDPSKLPLLNEKENEEIRRVYNCDLNNRDELFKPSTVNIGDKTLLAFKQRLEEIVGRRDYNSAKKIDNLLKGALPSNRFFFAVGFVHLMSPTGIVAKLRRDYNYSITRLCTDPPDFRSTLGCQGPSWCDPISGL